MWSRYNRDKNDICLGLDLIKKNISSCYGEINEIFARYQNFPENSTKEEYKEAIAAYDMALKIDPNL